MFVIFDSFENRRERECRYISRPAPDGVVRSELVRNNYPLHIKVGYAAVAQYSANQSDDLFIRVRRRL